MNKKKSIHIMSIFIIIILVSIFFFEYGNDYYWHTKIGEHIIKTRTIPFTDCFSWYGSLNKLNWTSHEWLFEIVINIFHKLFNKNGAIIYVFLMMIVNSYLTFLLNKKEFIKNSFNTIVWSLIGLMTFCSYILPRPHLISYMFFTIILLIIKNLLENEKSKSIYITPIIILLWANMHGGSSNLGYILFFITIISGILPINKKLNINKKQLLKLAYAFITSILFIIINPHGLKMLIYPYQNISYSVMINCIDEWQPINITSINSIFYIIFISYLLYVIYKNLNKLNIFEILLIILFSILAIKAIRFIPFLFIASTLVIPKYWKTNRFIINEKVVLIFLIILHITFIYTYKLPEYNKISDTMINYLKQNKNNNIYNSYNLGGYLIYKDVKPFIDSRADMYANNILCDVCEIEKNGDYDKLEKYKFDTFIIENKSSIYNYLSKNKRYKKVLSDNKNTIYILKGEN